jgi:DNA-binding response OmpR family regulator
MNNMLIHDQKSFGKKILIADDDPAIVDSLQFMLEEAGFKVMATLEGEQVEKMVKEQDRPDLLLLDIWMSGYDGRQICKSLKTTNNTKSIPVIMFSATKDIEKTTIQSGADCFIEKPFDMHDLLEKVEKHIN